MGVLDVVALGFVGLIGQLALAESRDETLVGTSERVIRQISFGATDTQNQFTFLTIWVLLFFVGKALGLLFFFTEGLCLRSCGFRFLCLHSRRSR